MTDSVKIMILFSSDPRQGGRGCKKHENAKKILKYKYKNTKIRQYKNRKIQQQNNTKMKKYKHKKTNKKHKNHLI